MGVHPKDIIATTLYILAEDVEKMATLPSMDEADEVVKELNEVIRMIYQWAGQCQNG